MFELLLYANLSCLDTVEMIQRVDANKNVSEAIRKEVIEVLQEASPECNWDAND